MFLALSSAPSFYTARPQPFAPRNRFCFCTRQFLLLVAHIRCFSSYIPSVTTTRRCRCRQPLRTIAIPTPHTTTDHHHDCPSSHHTHIHHPHSRFRISPLPLSASYHHLIYPSIPSPFSFFFLFCNSSISLLCQNSKLILSPPRLTFRFC